MRCSRVTGLLAAFSLTLQGAAAAQLPPPSSATRTTPAPSILPAGTPVIVTTASDLSTAKNTIGDPFDVMVAEDVALNGVIVIPKGTVGHGEVTFASPKDGFGKPGLLSIALRTLDLGGKKVALDGRYREEGKNNDAAAGVTMFAVGIFAGFIQGKTSLIPKGRTLKARTGEDIPLAASVAAPLSSGAPAAAAAPTPPAAVTPVIQ